MKLVVTHKPCCKQCKVFQCSQWLISRLESMKCINKTIYKHAPLRSISNRKQKFLAKPWLTAGLRKSIRVKNNLFYTLDQDKYKFYRNKIIYLTRLSKANYCQSFFDLNICNMRQTWKGINEVIGNCKKKNKRNSTNSICSNPKEVSTSDPKEITKQYS
ncbi:unnamed protein product, partial [Porites lobata]